MTTRGRGKQGPSGRGGGKITWPRGWIKAVQRVLTYPAASVEQLALRQLRLGLELRPPVAERLERDPLGLAILPLIQLATTPRLMLRPPKRLAVTRAGQDLVRHLVLLICKIEGRPDRVRQTPQQVCEKLTLTITSGDLAVAWAKARGHQKVTTCPR